jgi:hypothetical protein
LEPTERATAMPCCPLPERKRIRTLGPDNRCAVEKRRSKSRRVMRIRR